MPDMAAVSAAAALSIRNLLSRAKAGLALAALAVAAAGCEPWGGLPEGDSDAGKRIYWQGLTRDGTPVEVTVQGDVQASSDNFACVGCHRPSGFGSTEGGQFVPPITQPILFEASRSDRERRNRRFRELFKSEQGSSFDAQVRMPRMRPAYNEETLAEAIREGHGPEGRELGEAMPRYDFSDQAVADLIAYLETLSVEKSPGVGEDKLHLATIVSERADPAEREAVIETIRRFVTWYNRDIQGQLDHTGFSPFYRSEFKDSYRLWEPHLWTVEGPRSSWPEQLEEQYGEQKVFAVVSGLVDGPWEPVHEFCNAQQLPCVFPNTPLPETENARYGYSIYFSRGLELEGEVLASYLAKREEPVERIRQVRADQPAGRVPAKAFLEAARDELGQAEISTERAASRSALVEAVRASGEGTADVLVIWPGDHAGAAVEALNADPPEAGTVVLPSTALRTAKEGLSDALRDRVRLTHPYEKPTGYHPRQYRVRAWMHSRGLDVTHPRLQLQTYYALTQTQFGIAHLVSDFYRDYFIEFVEQEAEAELNPGTHPTLSLGPGQRFASKGAYIVAVDPEAKGGYRAVSEWIVP